ncbi:MAG: precorrin-3B C(17)-methyltransferase [Bacteroidaceae bacterium]|nr:precorrin-3B C(17)-methyltransferase [Bacteroidaceae bacterium]
MSKIIIAGLGPGSPEDMTPAVLDAVREADIVVGYKYYFRFVEPYLKPGCQCIDTGMKRERERAEQAFCLAEEGKTVVVISSGDASIYGMAPLVYEMKRERGSRLDIIVLPGISAFQKAASLLGAPIGHDLCIISLSDLMTPWALIEKRIRAAAVGDFVTAVYNPKSHGRYWQLYRLRELFLLEGRSATTPVGIVRQAGRPEQEITLTTLADLDPEQVDMFCVLIIGNSQSYEWQGKFITPRGYYRNEQWRMDNGSAGQQIMNESFRTILSEMKNPDVPRWRLWPLLHAIHTTVDFSMEQCLWMDDRATERIYNKVVDGSLRHIVTDVTMAASGIRKGALERLGIEVHCYINDPRSKQMAQEQNITRSQACMQLAAEEYPEALYVVGNAPTALFEICDLVRKGKLRPAGIIGAPVGFVHVCESKYAAKTLTQVPKIIVEGRKGGSNLAATLVNAILTYDDAEQLKPGRDL